MEMSRMFAQYFTQKRGDVRKQRKAIAEALKAGPASVSKITEATKYEKDLVVWNLMGMLRWGEVEVAGEEEHEMVYKLKEV
jgi:hypothetical protein